MKYLIVTLCLISCATPQQKMDFMVTCADLPELHCLVNGVEHHDVDALPLIVDNQAIEIWIVTTDETLDMESVLTNILDKLSQKGL